MKDFCTIGSILNENNSITDMFYKLSKDNSAEAYVFLGPKNNMDIFKGGFFTIPKFILSELEFVSGSRSFDNTSLDILHPLRCNTENSYSFFRSFNDLEELNSADLLTEYEQLKQIARLNCRVIKTIGGAAANPTDNYSYSNGFSTLLRAISEANNKSKLLQKICTATVVEINVDNIFIKTNSSFYALLISGDPGFSLEFQIVIDLRKELVHGKQYVAPIDFTRAAKKWLKSKFNNISYDAIERIIGIAKPDLMRKHSWYERKVTIIS